MKSTIKVLVVDDAEFLRKNLPLLLERDKGIEVVGTAATGYEGVEMAKRLRPDVITMDVVMPRMNGIEALKIIMREVPTPVVMVSSLTREGAAETLEALTMGAVDYITKPSGQVSLDITKIRHEIIRKVKLASVAKVAAPVFQPGTFSSRFSSLAQELAMSMEEDKIVEKKEQLIPIARVKVGAIGIAASTGGPMALQAIFSALPKDYPIPICAVQHIESDFISFMIDRFNTVSKLCVKGAEDGERLQPGTVYFSPGKDHLTVVKKYGSLVAQLNSEPKEIMYRPSANELFWSLGANLDKGSAVGIVLTGMGDDGAMGLKRIKETGGYTVAQDEKSSVVYGMPEQAVAMGGTCESLSLEEIILKLMQLAC